MRPRRVRLLRHLLVRLGLVVGVQIPAIAALAQVLGWLAAVAISAALTSFAVPELRNLWDPRPRARMRLALSLLFYAWWMACLVFLAVAPVGALVAWTTRVTVPEALSGVALVALLGGLRAIWARPRLVRRSVRVEGLPLAFHGYRIAQLSDVHCGPYTPARRVRRWVRRINHLGVDLVAITGDLITSGSLHVDAVATALGGLQARDGVCACLGNHDYFTDAEAFVRALRGAGLRVLRNEGFGVARGNTRLYVAGADDTWTGRADVARALALRPPAAPAVLLAHDPDLFPQAAAAGVDLMLAGHTHGGQLGVPGFARRWNLARLITPFTTGLYRDGKSVLYVSRGAGTSGPPIRLGAPPEIALLTLEAA